MHTFRNLVRAFRDRGRLRRPRPGRLIRPNAEDQWRDYPSAGLTPSRLMSILREADAGSLGSVMQLFEEMEEKDPHLFSVANTRRLAVTGLPWQIVSASDVQPDAVDRAAADEAAAYCREVLAGLESFEEMLQHLALALGRNIAVAEMVWEAAPGGVRLVDLCAVDFMRLNVDGLNRVRILTKDSPADGMALPPAKFVVHTPHSVSGSPIRGGLLRVTGMVYLAKNLTLKDWLIFAEVFGMPVRIARCEPNATSEEKQELLKMLQTLGANAAGVFSRAVELQIVEANRGSAGPPYEHLVDFLNREMSKVWLGQTLTTETPGTRGTFTAARVHEEVRGDIRADDLRKEARTLRRDLLAPLTRFAFGPDVPVPYFRRRLDRADELERLAAVLDVAVNRLGARVPVDWAHEALGIPRAEGDSTALTGAER